MTDKPFELEVSKLAGDWYGIEHNIHNLPQECVNSTDSFVIAGNSIVLTKTCISKKGVASALSGAAPLQAVTGNSIRLRFQQKGILSSSTITYVVYGTDYSSYMIAGNGKPGLFRIMARKNKVDVCWLIGIEKVAAKLGFDVSDVIREHGTIVPCSSGAKTSK